MEPHPASRGFMDIFVLRKVQAGDLVSSGFVHGRASVQLPSASFSSFTPGSGIMLHWLNTYPHCWDVLVAGAAMLFHARSRITMSHFCNHISPFPQSQSTTPAMVQFSKYPR